MTTEFDKKVTALNAQLSEGCRAIDGPAAILSDYIRSDSPQFIASAEQNAIRAMGAAKKHYDNIGSAMTDLGMLTPDTPKEKTYQAVREACDLFLK